MKYILLITILVFYFTSFSQSKAELLGEIGFFSDSLVNGKTYKTDKITFRRHLISYFITNGYKVESYNDSLYLFSNGFPIICSDFSDTRKARVEVFITQEENEFSISSKSYWEKNHLPRKYQKCRSFITYMEIDLKKYLYIMYNGKSIQIPVELQSKIDIYNAKQLKKKNKLVQGKDY